MKLGLQIPDFTTPDGPPRLGADLATVARTADEGGFEFIAVMDHFFQIRGVGPAEREMLEALISAFEASEDQAKDLRDYAATKKTLDDIPVEDLSDDDARILLQHAVLLTYVDGEQHEKEKELVHALAKKLGVELRQS